ncbi:hypothetical protein HPG69_016414 [Diceros bicornis minor]|uniref:Ig-like domain-containing protein n=1 Tax=Diceros bicornis minor TaxID=77932 RepID=A0A7J7EFJ3_DICBM|nr:hypothetical protein HPG69_016414 [Diceros bicornis minor]
MKIECHATGFQAQTVFWYRQLPKQGLTLIVTSNRGSTPTYEQDFGEKKFLINHSSLTFSTLTVESARPADSSLYFCGANSAICQSPHGQWNYSDTKHLVVGMSNKMSLK